ncbi:MAG: tRNA uridine-5-carboxymethylaminomethyl(34) synthesis GTPase MnmE [Proteobacteria bacterium]|nr:tRNA uridine-5-carboxymethylaminomethyl(34) synthesis GTPase MnmE [Pseudomonadota bacterium]
MTIFALSSAAGRAGVAVIRVSGPAAASALRALAGIADPRPRHAELTRLSDPSSGEALDDGLALWFPAPHSFTGEDVAEFHIHGGRATVGAVLEALSALDGLRPAEPGEFTRRAFENGKLDLTQSEGLADLINAETEGQRRQALRQLEGELGALYDTWSVRLVRAQAHLEAGIDFADEDVPEGAEKEANHHILWVQEQITHHLDDGRAGERAREGLYIAIIGAPNVGKSSLLNRLARRDAAIVAESAGTTRDVIEVHLDVAGYPVILADTAGLRAADGEVETEGVRRAMNRASSADYKIAVFDARLWPQRDAETEAFVDQATLIVANKWDLAGRAESAYEPALPVSAKTGEGLDNLLAALEEVVLGALGGSASAPRLTRARHRAALEECRAALERAASAEAIELRAEDVRLAIRSLGRITGRVDVEDVLDVIFSEFCIGK